MKLSALVLITLALGASAANLRNRAAPVVATGELSAATKAAIEDMASDAAGRDKAAEEKEAEVVSTQPLPPPAPLPSGPGFPCSVPFSSPGCVATRSRLPYP